MVLPEIKNRRSIREYKSDKVKDEDILEIIKAAQFAPTSRNNRAVEFMVIKEQKTKDKIYEFAEPKQEFLKQAPILIIPISDSGKSNLTTVDLSLATENIFLEATHLGLGCVWRNIYPEIADQIKKLLGVPEKFVLINIIPIGYPKNKPDSHQDRDFSLEKIHFEKY
jgi:nitroreductase